MQVFTVYGKGNCAFFFQELEKKLKKNIALFPLTRLGDVDLYKVSVYESKENSCAEEKEVIGLMIASYPDWMDVEAVWIFFTNSI